ncbi:thiamine diphosphokinase [Paraliobacillus sp. JSM ZJ581]|uniref:thiamine diphosphokinase n=1 Tax=Paraliobacillus sp. JSM ZJ581 TaxID=3342118 RepID=UPI0035A8E257
MTQQVKTVGIVAGGPDEYIADLSKDMDVVDYWIGADYGCITLLNQNVSIDLAIGDFDSMDAYAFANVKKSAKQTVRYSIEKDQTDLELAINNAKTLFPDQIYLYGVTGGRMDHALANVQQLLPLVEEKIEAIIIDKYNVIQLYEPGTYCLEETYPFTNISFLSFTQTIEGLSLEGFYYPLNKHSLSWGSTRCLSNKLLSKKGTFSFDRGILIMIKSCDVLLK